MNKRIFSLVFAFIAMVTVMGGCDTTEDEVSTPLTGTVTVSPGVVLIGGEVRADIDLKGGRGAYSYVWEYKAAGGTAFSPITNPVLTDEGRVITLTESDQITAGTIIQVTVSRGSSEGITSDNTAKIFDGEGITVTAITIGIVGGHSMIEPDTDYTLSVTPTFSESDSGLTSDEIGSITQSVTWKITELSEVDDDLNKTTVDVTSTFLRKDGVLHVKSDAGIPVNILTITAVSDVTISTVSPTPISLTMDWEKLPYIQLNPANLDFHLGGGGDKTYYSNPEVGFTILPDGTGTYFIKNGKSAWWWEAAGDGVCLWFDGFEGFSGSLNGKTKISVDVGFVDVFGGSIEQFGSYVFMDKDFVLQPNDTTNNIGHLYWFGLGGNANLTANFQTVDGTGGFEGVNPLTSTQSFDRILFFFVSPATSRSDNGGTIYVRNLRAYH